LSARAYDRILGEPNSKPISKDREAISSARVAEAVGYRSLARTYSTWEQAELAKLLIRLGKTQFLGSGKATTRSKRRITPALRHWTNLAPHPTGY
jgi:hypothetical protein